MSSFSSFLTFISAKKTSIIHFFTANIRDRLKAIHFISSVVSCISFLVVISVGFVVGFILGKRVNNTGNIIKTTAIKDTRLPCHDLIIRLKVDDSCLLYFNGQFVLNATLSYEEHEYSIPCVTPGDYLIAVLATGLCKLDAPNAFAASVSHGNTEVSYTGDGKWLGVDGRASGDWMSNLNYNDSGWTSMDSSITTICKPKLDSSGLLNSNSKYVAVPDCSTQCMINSFRLKLSISNILPSTALTEKCQSLVIRAKFYDHGEIYVNGKLILTENMHGNLFRYSIACPKGKYLIAILASDSINGRVNGYGVSISHGDNEISHTGDGKFKATIGNATGDWKSNFNYDDRSWTFLDSTLARKCEQYIGSTDIKNSQSKYIALPNCVTEPMLNSVRLKVTI